MFKKVSICKIILQIVNVFIVFTNMFRLKFIFLLIIMLLQVWKVCKY